MGDRLELHEVLCSILNMQEADGDRHVYFQPPASVKMKYPAIKYSRKNIENRHANNKVYSQMPCYEVIVIDKNPDSKYVELVSQLSLCRFIRHYEADNLNHDVYEIYH